jgi:hypothetical protein
MIIVMAAIVSLFIGRDEIKSLGIKVVNGPLNKPWIVDNKNGASSRRIICRKFSSTLRKTAEVPLCPPQIPQNYMGLNLRL